MEEADHISADDAVRIYRIGKSTLFGWLREGKIRRFKRPGDRRTHVSRQELERFLEFREVGRPET